MNFSQLGIFLAKVLPTIRIKLQLSGLVVILVSWMLVNFAQPGNTSAMLTGGAIGISMIIFGQLFHFLKDFPEASRAVVFLGSFGLFCVLVIVLLVITLLLLKQPSMDVTLEEGNVSPAFAGTDGQVYNPAASHTAYSAPEHAGIFAADLDDEGLRRLVAELGTGVQYTMTEKNDAIEIKATMPYLKKMQGEGYITPMTVDDFLWLPPVLSFKVSNPRDQTLLITQAKIEASRLTNEDDPLLIVSDAMPYRKPGSNDDDARYYPLSFYNVSWGIVHTPVLRFSMVRNAEVESAAHTFQHTVPLQSFDGDLAIDLTNYIEPTVQREHTELNQIIGGLPRDFAEGHTLEYLNVIGQLEFKTERNEARLLNFRAKIYFSGFGPGKVNPSYKYNVYLPKDLHAFPITVPLSQCILGHSADHFLMAFNSPRSARYEMNINVHSSDGVTLSKRVILHTMVSRNYGLASPRRTNAFSVREGCT